MAELPRVTPEQKVQVMQRAKTYREISNNYEEWIALGLEDKDPRSYALVKQLLMDNKTFLSLFENALERLSDVEGFRSVVRYSKNRTEFYDEWSVLKIGLVLQNIPCRFEFLLQGRTANPDIKADLCGRSAYFEIKHIRELDEVSDIIHDFFAEYPSTFLLSIISDWGTTAYQARQLVLKVKSEIEKNPDKKTETRLDLGFAEVRIIPNKPRAETPLAFNIGLQGAPFRNTYRKIETLLTAAIRQFHDLPNNCPFFVVLDIEKLLIDSDDLEPILYGERNLCPALFSAPESDILNGLIWTNHGKPILYVNPKTKTEKKIDYSILSSTFDIRELRIVEYSN